MANPFASQVKSTSSAKFKSMTGKKSSGQSNPDGTQDSKAKAAKSGKNTNEYNVGGTVSAPSFARGGRSKGKGKNAKTNINIVIAGKGEGESPSPPMMPPRPPMAAPPGMGPPGAPPGGPPPGLPTMKRGGAITGEGRLEKIKAYGLSPIKKSN